MVYVGDDWAEDHHDVELVDDDGRRPARARPPEGLDGITGLHGLIAAHMPAAGYRVYAINPRSVARCRERHGPGR